MTKFEKTCIEQIPPYMMIFFLFVSIVVFLVRSPVIFVDDDYFSSLYGVRREHLKRIEISAELFRRIKFVRIASSTYHEAVVYAVQDSSKHPYCVLFPNRYAESAKRYSAAEPKIPTFIFSGLLSPLLMGGNAIYIENDEATDLYRAGLCAATLVKYTKNNTDEINAEQPKTIILYEPDIITTTARNSFASAFEKQASPMQPVYVISGGNAPKDRDCVVLWTQALDFLHTQTIYNTPVVLFSWLDPDFAPENVKVIVDDSPLAVLPSVLKAIKTKSPDSRKISIPSKYTIIQKRNKNIHLQAELRKAIRAKPPATGP